MATTHGENRIRVLVVDDSPSFRAGFVLALERAGGVEVVGVAESGTQAIEMASELKPDVITMDVVMSGMGGPDAARAILAERSLPIILLTNLARIDEQRMGLAALRLGVLDIVNKPRLAGEGSEQDLAHIIRLLQAASRVGTRLRAGELDPAVTRKPSEVTHVRLIVMSASTGGPPTIEKLLAALPEVTPPIVIAQHLAAGFGRSFAGWLANVSGRTVVRVEGEHRLEPSSVYVASDGHDMVIASGQVHSEPTFSKDLSPNADRLFQSTADAYGSRAVGVVLTGMGSDGAAGLRAMRTKGAITIALDEKSSIVFGMPAAAIRAGACSSVLSLDAMGARLAKLIEQSSHDERSAR